MKTKDYISINQFKNSFDQLPEDCFLGLNERILSKTIYKSQLKESLFAILQSKPTAFELLSREESYFDNLAQRIERKTNTVSSKEYWPEAKTEIEFQVPDVYFDQLADKIKSRLPNKRKKGLHLDWIPNLLNRPVYYLAAAMLCVALGIGYLNLSSTYNSSDLSLDLETLTKEEILVYIASNTDKIDLNVIANSNWESEISHHELSETDVNDLILTDEL